MNSSEAFWVEKIAPPSDPSLTPGGRTFVIGDQSRVFPDLGGHVPTDMGGAWAAAQIETWFWLEGEGLYADMLATPLQMIQRIRAWIAHTEASEFTHGRQSSQLAFLNNLLQAAELDPEPGRTRGWSLQYWVVITPLESGLAPVDRATRTLERMHGPEFLGPDGM